MSKKELILNTTLELVSELGLHGTSINLIIKKSNVAAGTVYHYFKNKEDLIDSLYFELKKEMGNAIVENIDEDIIYKEKFMLILRNLFYFFINNPKKFEYIENYTNSPYVQKEIKEITQRHYQKAIDFIDSGIKLGILRSMPIPLLTNLIFGNIACLVKMIKLEELHFTESLLESTLQSAWDSVKIN